MNWSAFQLWIRQLLGTEAQVESVTFRVSNLERKYSDMLKEITDLQNAFATFQAEAAADVSSLLSKVADLQNQITSLQGQETVSADDLAALSAMTTAMQQATADLHSKVSAPVGQ